jgi:hypothetical protein
MEAQFPKQVAKVWRKAAELRFTGIRERGAGAEGVAAEECKGA